MRRAAHAPNQTEGTPDVQFVMTATAAVLCALLWAGSGCGASGGGSSTSSSTPATTAQSPASYEVRCLKRAGLTGTDHPSSTLWRGRDPNTADLLTIERYSSSANARGLARAAADVYAVPAWRYVVIAYNKSHASALAKADRVAACLGVKTGTS